MSSIILFFSQYLYLLSGVYFLAFWFVLFLAVKDIEARRRMFLLSCVFVPVALVIGLLTTRDWFRPEFIFNTIFHIEDALFGFAITGIISAIYFFLTKKLQAPVFFKHWHKRALLFFVPFLSVLCIYVFHWSTFWSMLAVIMIALALALTLPWLGMKIVPMVLAGCIVTVIALPGYYIGSYLHPGWVGEYWLLKGLPGQLLFGIPLGEYAYYFFSTIFTLVVQEMWFAQKNNQR